MWIEVPHLADPKHDYCQGRLFTLLWNEYSSQNIKYSQNQLDREYALITVDGSGCWRLHIGYQFPVKYSPCL